MNPSRRHFVQTGLLTGFLAAAGAVPAWAQPQAVDRAGPRHGSPITGVVELFTSQGCSSCPPADKVLAGLADREDILALSYHVDYWNYLGWKDTLSDPAHTARQYGYARRFDRQSVYTPQAVINGRDHVVGSHAHEVDALLATFAGSASGLTIPVTLRHAGDTLSVDVAAGRGKANLVLVVFDHRNVVEIGRGENGGHALVYRNSVRSLQTIGMWDGQAMTLTLPSSLVGDWQRQGCAVLLQEMGSRDIPGAIRGAVCLAQP
jgi:hypothetical protein